MAEREGLINTAKEQAPRTDRHSPPALLRREQSCGAGTGWMSVYGDKGEFLLSGEVRP